MVGVVGGWGKDGGQQAATAELAGGGCGCRLGEPPPPPPPNRRLIQGAGAWMGRGGRES